MMEKTERTGFALIGLVLAATVTLGGPAADAGERSTSGKKKIANPVAALRRLAGKEITDEEIERIRRQYNEQCYYCNKYINKFMEEKKIKNNKSKNKPSARDCLLQISEHEIARYKIWNGTRNKDEARAKIMAMNEKHSEECLAYKEHKEAEAKRKAEGIVTPEEQARAELERKLVIKSLTNAMLDANKKRAAAGQKIRPEDLDRKKIAESVAKSYDERKKKEKEEEKEAARITAEDAENNDADDEVKHD